MRCTQCSFEINEDNGPARTIEGRSFHATQNDCIDALLSENARLREAGEAALLNMQVMGNILNWPPEIPQEYADAINDLRAALRA